jgi:hypothetical protein
MAARKLTPKPIPWNFSDEPVRPEFEQARPAQALAIKAFEEETPPPLDRARVMFLAAASLGAWGVVIGLGWLVFSLVS